MSIGKIGCARSRAWIWDCSDLLDELRVRRELERFGDVRLETKRSPDATNGRAAHAGVRRHRARAPVGLARGRRLKGFHERCRGPIVRRSERPKNFHNSDG